MTNQQIFYDVTRVV